MRKDKKMDTIPNHEEKPKENLQNESTPLPSDFAPASSSSQQDAQPSLSISSSSSHPVPSQGDPNQGDSKIAEGRITPEPLPPPIADLPRLSESSSFKEESQPIISTSVSVSPSSPDIDTSRSLTPSSPPSWRSRIWPYFAIFFLFVLVVLGIREYIQWDVEKQIEKKFAEAQAAYQQGEILRAWRVSQSAFTLFLCQPPFFGVKFSEHKKDVLRQYEDAVKVMMKAQHIVREGEKSFEPWIQKMELLAQNVEQKGDPFLIQAIKTRRDQMVLTRVKEWLASEQGFPTVIQTLSDLQTRFGKTFLPSTQKEFDSLLARYLEQQQKQFEKILSADLERILSLLKSKNYQDAFEAPSPLTFFCQDVPSAFQEPFQTRYQNLQIALREGNAEDTIAASLSPEDRDQLRQFFRIQPILDDLKELVETAAYRLALPKKGRKDKTKEKTPAETFPLAQDFQKLEDRISAEDKLDSELLAFLKQRIQEGRHEVEALYRLDSEARIEALSGEPKARYKVSFLDAAGASPHIRFRLSSFQESEESLRMELRVAGVPIQVEWPNDGDESACLYQTYGYRFVSRKHRYLYPQLLRALHLGKRMQHAGIEPNRASIWEIIDGPAFPVAWALSSPSPTEENTENTEPSSTPKNYLIFYDQELYSVESITQKKEEVLEVFRSAAAELRKAIAECRSIREELRQALDPVIRTAYDERDPQDELDSYFCRRILAGDYLERHIPALRSSNASSTPQEATEIARIRDALQAYRAAFHSLPYGIPLFSLTQKNGIHVTAYRSIEEALDRIVGKTDEEAPEEEDFSLSSYEWRIYDPQVQQTTFTTWLGRQTFYRFYQHAVYPGEHAAPPADLSPIRLFVTHPLRGEVASWKEGDPVITTNISDWEEATAIDLPLQRRSIFGPPGWGYPPHIPDFGFHRQPRRILTRHGILDSPDFDLIPDEKERRAAQDAYLDRIVTVCPTPGEQALFFRYLAQYAFDSPIAEDPELLGSRLGAGEHHQTVYQFFDRRIGEVYVGDCDDLAEFYQVITQKCGKLSQMFNPPQHAACGYVDVLESEEGKIYRMIFLHTSEPYCIEGSTLDEAVEEGFKAFGNFEEANFTVAAVPFLFRFAGEHTRTRYYLSDRILVDPEYAELMIRVQSYWHYHYYSTAIRVMEERLAVDPYLSNYTELSGLYRFVHLTPKAIEMEQKAMQLAKERDAAVHFQGLLTIAGLYKELERDEEVKTTLAEIPREMMRLLAQNELQEYFRLLPIRMGAAGLYGSIEAVSEAIRLITPDIHLAMRFNRGRLFEPLLKTILSLYAGLGRRYHEDEELLSAVDHGIANQLEETIRRAFATTVFQPEDSWNQTIRNYSLFAEYAFAKIGRKRAANRLLRPGPLATSHRKHHIRGPEITEEDWAWFRIIPSLYFSLAIDSLDLRQPEKFDEKKALRLLEAMPRAYKAGAALGSMFVFESTMVMGELLQAILHRDRSEFETVMKKVRERNISDYDDAVATAMGQHLGLIPLEELPSWFEIYHRYMPGKQHYFKVVYRAIDSEHFDHALKIAKIIPSYFPDEEAMAQEAGYIEGLVEKVRAQAQEVRARREAKKAKKPKRQKPKVSPKESPPPPSPEKKESDDTSTITIETPPPPPQTMTKAEVPPPSRDHVSPDEEIAKEETEMKHLPTHNMSEEEDPSSSPPKEEENTLSPTINQILSSSSWAYQSNIPLRNCA